MTKQDIDTFEKVQAQLESLHSEISALSKKEPNDPLNNFKLKFVNQILIDANKILSEKYMPFSDFEVFNDQELPFNSDVTMVISQYLSCMEKLRNDNIFPEELYSNGRIYKIQWFWKDTKQETYSPVKIK